jgi:hypothetical protein
MTLRVIRKSQANALRFGLRRPSAALSAWQCQALMRVPVNPFHIRQILRTGGGQFVVTPPFVVLRVPRLFQPKRLPRCICFYRVSDHFSIYAPKRNSGTGDGAAIRATTTANSFSSSLWQLLHSPFGFDGGNDVFSPVSATAATARPAHGIVITVKDNTVSLRSADAKMEITKSSVAEIIESGGTTES